MFNKKSSKLIATLLLACMVATPQTTKPLSGNYYSKKLLNSINPFMKPIVIAITSISAGIITYIFTTRNEYAKNLVSKRESIASYSITVIVFNPHRSPLRTQEVDRKRFIATTAANVIDNAIEWMKKIKIGLSFTIKPAITLHDLTDYELLPIDGTIICYCKEPNLSTPASGTFRTAYEKIFQPIDIQLPHEPSFELFKNRLIDVFYVPVHHHGTYGKRMLLWTLPIVIAETTYFLLTRAIKNTCSGF